jgi:CO dehydrogenase maturation factor
MTTTIALAGKGGVGKTTLAALIVQYLSRIQDRAILAIDADPSSNLNMALGLDLEWTVGDIREHLLVQVKGLDSGAQRWERLRRRDEARLPGLPRSPGGGWRSFDLIAGPLGGAGCYCAVNHNLREVMRIGKTTVMVIDNGRAWST